MQLRPERDGFEMELMSRWECNSGHVLEGLFYATLRPGEPASMPSNMECPYCDSAMQLARGEAAMRMLDRVRDFVEEVSKHPDYQLDSSRALTDLGRLEAVIKKMSLEVLRP